VKPKIKKMWCCASGVHDCSRESSRVIHGVPLGMKIGLFMHGRNFYACNTKRSTVVFKFRYITYSIT